MSRRESYFAHLSAADGLCLVKGYGLDAHEVVPARDVLGDRYVDDFLVWEGVSIQYRGIGI